MALVGYDSSDNSDNSENENIEIKPIKATNKFLSLPTCDFDEEDDAHFNKILNKTEKQPNLKETNKKSGLMNLLPKPKSLIISNSKLKLIPQSVKNTKKELISSQNEEIPFFSFVEKKKKEIPSNSIPENEKLKLQNSARFGYGKYAIQPIETQAFPKPVEVPERTMDNNEIDLVMTGGKRKRPIQMENIVDISQADLMGDIELIQSKRLTDEADYMSQIPKTEFSGQQRRKHQMTYLAYQAKERELELKNQWAANRASQRETRKKYGF
ncbi:hypothetical protein LOD99_12959 [Oopsacas minuta]|uniref:Proline-rich protein PRCC n=1 Tax=Oopsacas minuta TaxID=111878 RepID=A0AAV7JAK8_9METZ|nr:hypothetical protein LOD99_12959 [Oopsacas minuta]